MQQNLILSEGDTFQMKHGSVPLVVNNRHDRSRPPQWAPSTKDPVSLLIRWKDIHDAIPCPHSESASVSALLSFER